MPLNNFYLPSSERRRQAGKKPAQIPRGLPWGRVYYHFLDTLFPKECVGCKKEGFLLCPGCYSAMRGVIKFSCPGCGNESFFGRTCKRCAPATPLDGLLFAGFYGNPILRDAIYAWKYSFVERMGDILCNVFLDYAEKYRTIFAGFKEPLVQSVPLWPKRLLWRGFNQADILAGVLAGHLGVQKIDVLLRHKKTTPQSELDARERRGNIVGAFIAGEKAKETVLGRTVILVDDIYTSGSTLEECARVLKNAGAKEVWGFVLAKG